LKSKFRYEELSWPEIKEAIKDGKVVLLVLGSMEQHGPHLPVGTDSFLGYEVCRRAAEIVPDDVLLLPPLYFAVTEQ